MNALRTYIGIDLGSTTTKAVVLNDAGEVIGRGITNSRSNYDVACQVVREEALIRTRFTLARQAIAAIRLWRRSRKLSFPLCSETSDCGSISISSRACRKHCCARPTIPATAVIVAS